MPFSRMMFDWVSDIAAAAVDDVSVVHLDILQFSFLRFGIAIERFQFVGGVLGDVFHEIVNFASALVFLWRRFRVFRQPEECWETAHLEFWWHIVGGRIEFNDGNVFVAQFLAELIEYGRQFLAVAAPWSVELSFCDKIKASVRRCERNEIKK